MKISILIVLILISFNLIAENVSPLERANQIKEWRANCSDPDPDLRLAYLEAAIATNDQTVARTCIKQALVSKDSDLRNLALRTAIASAGRLSMEFSLPDEYLKKLEKLKAEDNGDKIKTLQHEYKTTLWLQGITNGIIGLTDKEVDVKKQESIWYTFGINQNEDKSYIAQFSLTGNKFSGGGNVQLNHSYIYRFNVSLKLNDNGELQGFGNMINRHGESSVKLPVKIKIY